MLQMKGDTNDGPTELEHLLKGEDGVDHWLGYNAKHGWLLLDRSIDGNEPGIGGNSTLRFIRLTDWRLVAVPRENWHNGSIKIRPATFTPEEKAKLQALLLEWHGRRGGWVAQRRRKETQRRWIEEIPKLLVLRATEASVASPIAIDKDLMLCLTWSNLDLGTDLSFDALLRRLHKGVGSYHASRLISARLAERCAAIFYEGLGDVVLDTSIEQLIDAIQGNWRDFDLDVGYPVDVKNSRATLNGKKHYSEHAVSKFKQDRIGRQDVKIVGVRSPYIPDPKEAARGMGGSDVMVLGEVSAADISRLESWMEANFGHLLSLQLWAPKKIPGWLFEYPERYYVGRAQAAELMQTLSQAARPMRVSPGQWLVAKALKPDLDLNVDFDPMLAELGDLVETCGLAKRCLIVYAMGATLRAVLEGEDAVLIIAKLRDAANIGQSSRSRSYPWGLEDPLDYVDRFMRALSVLAEGIKPYISSTRIFRLTGPEVLVAEMHDGSRRTMLAYCGGWIDGKGRCGASPLVVGRHEPCSECRYLICSDCFFCSTDCESERRHRSQSAGINARDPWRAYTETSDDFDHVCTGWETDFKSESSWGSNV